MQCVPKKGGITVVANEKNELVHTRKTTCWRICMEYRKLNKATNKYHFLLPFIDQTLDRLARKAFYYFLDGYSSYNQIDISPEDQDACGLLDQPTRPPSPPHTLPYVGSTRGLLPLPWKLLDRSNWSRPNRTTQPDPPGLVQSLIQLTELTR
ncbi:uncharacterized protein LOC120211006 [Hibiscus syriacus]|uniref:uncharacterized protein LOC120211006 n=1 Tax=Hibiscus syriacus TaxID=106335 RepID=UPI0019235877|nr:uncharacterized protein LOC120211006 [Hibiscus syriacus]